MGETAELKMVIQEPQFLPFVGLWFKIMACEKYVINAGIKFDQYDHQHRVTIPTGWLTLPLASNQRNLAIKNVRLAENAGAGVSKIIRTIRMNLMSKAQPYRDRLDPVVVDLEKVQAGDFLVDVTTRLMFTLAEILQIPFNPVLDLDERSEAFKLDRLNETIEAHSDGRSVIYLAGAGSRAYMNFGSLTAPKKVVFHQHKEGINPHSVMQLIAQAFDPLEEIRNCGQWRGERQLELLN